MVLIQRSISGRRGGISFRPLAGIMVLIDSVADWLNEQFLRRGFRPLAGIMVLIETSFFMNMTEISGGVSVPLRGLWFLSIKRRSVLIRKIASFRPLAGIMVLIILDDLRDD